MRDAIAESEAKSVLDVWRVFSTFFVSFASDLPKTVTNLGVMAEFNSNEPDNRIAFYFSLHCLIDDGEYNFSEWVYCEFEIPPDIIFELSTLKNECLELWDWDYHYLDILKAVENWTPFEKLADKVLGLRVHGSES